MKVESSTAEVIATTVSWSPSGTRVTAYRGTDFGAVHEAAIRAWRGIEEWSRGPVPSVRYDDLLGGYVATVTQWSAE